MSRRRSSRVIRRSEARSSSRHSVRRVFALLALAGAAASLVRGGRWFPISRYVVEGPSMEPAYRAGDRLIVNRLAYFRSSPRVGDAVVLRDPEHRDRLLLKRVGTPPSPAATGMIYVLGDNTAESRDSRHFGAIARSLIIGRAWQKY